jgi:hypothetical protein
MGGSVLRIGMQFRLFEVTVTNSGPDRATGIEIEDQLVIEATPEPALGATLIWDEDPIDLPLGATFMVSQPAADVSRAEITLPDLEAGQAHSLRFWTISTWLGTPESQVTLTNRAEADVATIDTNTVNNSATESVGLNP